MAKSTISLTTRKYSENPIESMSDELVLEARDRLGRHRLVAVLEPAPRLLGEHRVRRLAARDLGRREVELPERQVELAARRDLERGVARARQPLEQPAHLGRGLEPQLGVGAVVRSRQRRARAGRREHVVEAVVLGAQVVDVVGGDDRQRELVGERRRGRRRAAGRRG